MGKFTFTILFLLAIQVVLHCLMIGTVSFVQWDNFFIVSMGDWDALTRVIYLTIQGTAALIVFAVSLELS